MFYQMTAKPDLRIATETTSVLALVVEISRYQIQPAARVGTADMMSYCFSATHSESRAIAGPHASNSRV